MFLNIVRLWCWYDFFFLLGERMISEALLECPCLHIDHLSSLRALSLTFEKANNMKPVFIFSLVRSWAFPHLFTSTKGYIISFIFLNLYQNDKVEKIHNCFETDANQNCCTWNTFQEVDFCEGETLSVNIKMLLDKINKICYQWYSEYSECKV